MFWNKQKKYKRTLKASAPTYPDGITDETKFNCHFPVPQEQIHDHPSWLEVAAKSCSSKQLKNLTIQRNWICSKFISPPVYY